MAIDTTIDYQCAPKQHFGTAGILDRIKGRERAQAVIDLFRQNGDLRPADEIGFELARTAASGQQETVTLMVKDLLEAAAELTPYAHFCQGCPANNIGQPFGCYGQVAYPISGAAERWLLRQLPSNTEPLAWLLLRRSLEELANDGSDLDGLRAEGQPYFQERSALVRKFGEFAISANQVFRMLFLMGTIQPSYGALLLIFFGAIRRNLEADELMSLSASPEDAFERYPFQLRAEASDDASILQLKRFFRAVYTAWGLNVRLLLDV
jgi:hypothetical protein